MRSIFTTSLTALLCLAAAAPPAFAADKPLSQEDTEWLDRVTFGLDTATVASYRDLGRRRFLEAQLHPKTDALPQPIAAQIAGFDVMKTPPETLLATVRDQYRDINAMPDGDAKQEARKALQKQGNDYAQQAQAAELLRAIYDENQLREQLVWFWLNHFSVFKDKGRVRWLVADYAQNTIRPHALGKFRDLVMATLKSPAMLEYLDNAQNARDKINENYARELMELHTLGVNSGYTQADVQSLAHILTGVGVNFDGQPRKLRPDLRPYYLQEGVFEFNPNRHDFGDQILLGKTIKGGGFDEVEKAVDLIVSQPACATFISTKLAKYFVSDNPSPSLIAAMAKTFRRSDGDIAKVMETMLTSKEFTASLGKRYKDPTQFLVSTMRLAYDGKPVENPRPLVNWITQLGQAPFGRITPDGWPVTDSEWSSSGQVAKRFEIARSIGSGANHLFDLDDTGKRSVGGFPQLTTPTYYATIEPTLGPKTRAALSQATSQQEWNTFLLASPEFNYR
ncbi:DUF1800 domain-containing protein [Luteibacter sp. UNCMF366Tsu5.1]|uniref:DUF1800 domain-containing protein n=1 Tax=Luteibacter sp. UNCMF366Tsu5.1 TaxID=1502758 RepID=UPI0009087800|nr:DUF1800 domain-containing protein [Luteibacter sp. UNCMF366Tsu5.1]SFW24562.1 Uncharacterized conserved protein, DUF1800 family [Luteibacter sp. UNCMF366Tsu5.1]